MLTLKCTVHTLITKLGHAQSHALCNHKENFSSVRKAKKEITDKWLSRYKNFPFLVIMVHWKLSMIKAVLSYIHCVKLT